MSSAFRLSLGANLLLLGIVAVLLWRDRPTAPSSAPVAAPTRLAAGRSEPMTTEAPSEELSLKSTDARHLPATLAQLAQQGIAREVLINVLLEDLNRRSTQRVVALQKKYAPKSVPDHEMIELSRQSITEQIRELKAAFGEAGYQAWDQEQTLHALNRARVPGDELPMTAAEAEQAYRLQKEFDQQNRELQIAMEDGVADKADAGLLQAQAQQTLDRELEKLLGPQRFAELRGTVDPTTEVHRTYGTLNPTPDQAQAVLLAESDHHAREAVLTQRLNANPNDNVMLMAELQALNETREDDLRRIFGDTAYDALKQQNDPTYQTLRQYAGAWQLQEHEIQSTYAALSTFFDQADRTRRAAELSEAAGQRVNWRSINAGLEQARLQTEAGLQNLLGAERLQRLKQNGVLDNR